MKIPEVFVKEFKKISFALAEDEVLFERLKKLTKEEFWSNIDQISEEKAIFRTMEGDHIAFILDSLDQLLENNIEILKRYEMGEDYKIEQKINEEVNQNRQEQQAQPTSSKTNQKAKDKQSADKHQSESEMQEETRSEYNNIPITREVKEQAQSNILKILLIQSKLLKKDQYKFLYRQLDRILEILNWSDSLIVKRNAIYIMLLIVVIDEGQTKHDFAYLRQHQLDKMSFFVRFYILHINSFNEGYIELSGLFKFDDERYYKLEMQQNSKYKTRNVLDFQKIQQIQKELDQQEISHQEKTLTRATDESLSQLNQDFEDVFDQEEKLKQQLKSQQKDDWIELENKSKHFEFFENSINTKPINNLSVKPILQKLSEDNLIEFQLTYDDSLTLYQNAKKILKEKTGKDYNDTVSLFSGLKERLIILKHLQNRESRIEIAKIFLLSIQILSFFMKIAKKHMQSIITDQQLALEKFQKSFPKQVTDLIHLKLDPKLHTDVIKFMLVIIKEQSQLRKGTEDYLSKQSDSLIYKIYTDCSNLELQPITFESSNMEIEQNTQEMNSQSEDIRNRKDHTYKIVSKGQTVQESTLLQSKFIDYALTFVNTILKYPDSQGQSFQEVTPFSMNFVQIPFRCEYLTYNLKQIRKAIHSLSLLIQIEDIQREYKILFKILDKIEYYLDQKPKFQWIDGKWQPISQKQYDIFLGQLLRIINQIFETSTKRSRRITPQLAKQLTECPKFFIILGNCIDRVVKGYTESESYVPIPDPSVVQIDSEQILLIETVHLLSNINKENPNLIEKLLEEQIVQKTIAALQVQSLPRDSKSISQIIYFLYHISLKEQGRKEISESKLLQKIFDIFVDDNYAEEFYAYTLNSVIEAIQNYYQNIKEIVEVIYEKLNDLLLCLRKKCITYTEQIENYLNFSGNIEQEKQLTSDQINFRYRNVICYQIFNVCKLLEKLITGIENVYPDQKNKYAGECLLNYLEILQFPFLFLMPQRSTHKTPFFSVKTTCKAIYSKLNTKSEVENNKINKVLDVNIQRIEELLGNKIENIKNLNLQLVADLTAKNFNKLIQENKDLEFYQQIKLYQCLQFLDAMINTFRSLRITQLMNNYQEFVQKISNFFPITFNQRFYEQFSFVKNRIVYLEEQALLLRKMHETDNENIKSEEYNLECEYKEFRNYFKENILSFKNHVNHYSYQNIIFYTILKLVYQNYSLNDDLDLNSSNKQDVLRLISLTINNIDINSIDIKILEKYDIKALEVFSSLAGSLVMLTQILQIFMKEPKLINYMILNNLQKEGSIGKIIEMAQKFTELWQQIELKSLQKNSRDIDEQSKISKDSQSLIKKLQTITQSSIDHCLETINYKLEYFFKMISLQISFTLNFKKEQKEEYREEIRQGIYGWHYEQIKSQYQILKSIKGPSKNRYYSMLIEFLITHIELQLLPRYQNIKKFTENEKSEKADSQNQISEEQLNTLSVFFPEQSKEFLQFAIKEFKKEKQLQFLGPFEMNSLYDFITEKQETLQKLFNDQSNSIGQNTQDIKNETSLIGSIDTISHIQKIKKDEFYSKVKSDAEEMCSYLLRELFSFKNHSDQILALLLRKDLSEIEFIKSTINKIKEIQQTEKKKNTSMDVEENKTEEPTRRSRRGQSAGNTQQNRVSENQGGSSSISIQQGGDSSSISQLQPFSNIRDRNTENRNLLQNIGGSGAHRQEQSAAPQGGIFQSSSINLNNLNSTGQQIDRISLLQQNFFNDSFMRMRNFSNMNMNRYQLGSRARQGLMEPSSQTSNSSNLMQGQKQDKEQSKSEMASQFKLLINNWEDDYLIKSYQSVKENHNCISYVIFATINLLFSKIFKDFKFKNPFKGQKETILKLRNNQFLHVPSKQLDNNNIYKLELINSLIPFAEKFGFYMYKDINYEQQDEKGQQEQNKPSQSAQNQQIIQSNDISGNKSGSLLQDSNQQLKQSKLFTIKIFDQEDLNLKWKEGNESYSIGIEFIRMGNYLFTNGQNIFNTPKKGEDKENHKQSSFDTLTFFIKNQFHLIQKINSMNLKFKQSLKKELEKVTEQLQQKQKKISTPIEKSNREKQATSKGQLSVHSASQDNNAGKSGDTSSAGTIKQNLIPKKQKNINKNKRKNKKNKKLLSKEEIQKDKDLSSKKNESSSKLSSSKLDNNQIKLNEEKQIYEKKKQIQESQNLTETFEKEVVSMFVRLLRFNNEQRDYYGQSLISVNLLMLIIDTIKQYSENNKSYLNQFISENGINELLKIRTQTEQFDLILEKLNIFLTNITQDPIMAKVNYESKIKYYFFEKCIHQQTLMYQINSPFTSKKVQKQQKQEYLKKTKAESVKKTSSSNSKTKDDLLISNTQVNDQSRQETKQSPIKQSFRRSVSPQKQQKNIASQTQQILNQQLKQNQIPDISDKKLKKLKVSSEEFMQRFGQFKNIQLFQEIQSKLCETQQLYVKQKQPKTSSLSSKQKQKDRRHRIRRPSHQHLFQQFGRLSNENPLSGTDFHRNLNTDANNNNTIPTETGQQTSSSQNQDIQRQSQNQNQPESSISINLNNEQNNILSTQNNLKEKKSIKNNNATSKKKANKNKPKKKQFVKKEFYILRDDINLHQLQFIPKENFLSNISNFNPSVSVHEKQNYENKDQQKEYTIGRSQSASRYQKRSFNKDNISLFKQKSEGKQPSTLQSEQNLNDKLLNQDSKNIEQQNNYNQMINFVAPTQIYETVNQILESIVTQFTKKIIQNYDLIHKKQNNSKIQSDQNDEYLFNSITLIKAIQIIARQQAVLVPQIVRFRCSKIVKKIVQGHPLEIVFNKQLGNHFHFLKFITKCANYFSISQVKGLLFELCLDKQILYQQSCSTQNQYHLSHKNGSNASSQVNPSQNSAQPTPNQFTKIITFGAEIRKKVLGEIYSSIENEISSQQNILEKPHTIHLLISNILLHLNLLNIREVAKLSLRNFTSDLTSFIENESQQTSTNPNSIFGTLKENIDISQFDSDGYNFAKLYSEILKKFDISKMSQMQNVIVFVTSILEMLYILNYYFILYPSGISSGKNENKKKNEDYMCKFIQSQILTQHFQKHIKQYANHYGSFMNNILSTYPQEQFGSSRRSFNFPQFSKLYIYYSIQTLPFQQKISFSREQGLNPLSLFNSRNLLNLDPFNALSRFTQNVPTQFSFLNSMLGNNVSLRMNQDRDQNLTDSFTNHLRRNQLNNTFISRAARLNNHNVDSLLRRMDENGDGGQLNEGNRDEDANNLIMGRMDERDDNDDDDDDDEEEEEEEDEDEEQLGANFDESVEDEEEDDDEGDEDEEDEEEEEESDGEEEDEEEDEEVEEMEIDEDDVEEGEDEGDEDDDEEDNNDGDNLQVFDSFRENRRNRIRDNLMNFRNNIQARDNSSQRSVDYQDSPGHQNQARRVSRSSRNRGARRFDENDEPGSQQSVGNPQEDFIAEEDISVEDEDLSENADEDQEIGINEENHLEEEEEDEEDDDDEGEDVELFLNINPAEVEQVLIVPNQITLSQIEQNGQGQEENYEDENDLDNQDDEEDDEDNRDGYYYNEDWEDYSSGDEISEVGEDNQMSEQDYYRENSVDSEVDVRDRDDQDDDEQEDQADINIENQEEDDEPLEDLISEEEENIWNNHELSDDVIEQDDDDDDENAENLDEEDDDDDGNEIFDEYPQIIDLNNLVNQVDGENDDDIMDEEEENEYRINNIYEFDQDDNEDQNQRNNDNQNAHRGNRIEINEADEENDGINPVEEENDEYEGNPLLGMGFTMNRSNMLQDKEPTKLKEKINEDPDCKKQLSVKDITEFSNITMSNCLKETYKRCQHLIQVHYIGTNQQNITDSTCLKEVQKELAQMEKQKYKSLQDSDNQQQNTQNTSFKRDLTFLSQEYINKVYDQSVYVALLIFYKYLNFDSTYNKQSRSHYNHSHLGQDGAANNPQQSQQELNNAQMVSSMIMPVDRRSGGSSSQIGDLNRATQYRLNMRIPSHMQISSYNRHMHNRHQSQNRLPTENQESDIPGSTLNDLIQQVTNSNSQRTGSSSNNNFNNLNQLIRGTFPNLGNSLGGLTNFNQLVRQNSIFGNPQLFNPTSSYIGGSQRGLQLGNLAPVLLDGGPLDINLNFSIRQNTLNQLQSNQNNQLPFSQQVNLGNGQNNDEVNNSNNGNNNQQIQNQDRMDTEVQQGVQQNQNDPSSLTSQNQQSQAQQENLIPIATNINSIPEVRFELPSLINIQNQGPTSNQGASNSEQVNQIDNGFSSLAQYFLPQSDNQRHNNQQPRSNLNTQTNNNQNIQARQIAEQQNSRSNNQSQLRQLDNGGQSLSNNEQVNQLVNDFSSIAPLLLATLDTRQQGDQNRRANNNSSFQQSGQLQEISISSSQQLQNRENSQNNPNQTMDQERSSQELNTNNQQIQQQTSNQLSSSQVAINSNNIQSNITSSNQLLHNQNIQSQYHLSQNSILVLSRLNLDQSFLTRHGLDFQYFDELPDDIKEELIFSYIQDSDSIPLQVQNTQNNLQNSQPIQNQNNQQQGQSQNQSVDSNTQANVQANNQPTASLAINQSSVSNTSAAAPVTQINQANVEFVNSADINLRVDILIQSGDDFLRTLTQEMQDEARRLRENQGQSSRHNIMDYREFGRQRAPTQPSQNQQIVNQMLKKNQKVSRFKKLNSNHQTQISELQNILFKTEENCLILKKVNEIFKNDNIKSQKKQLRLIDDWINKDQFIYKKLIQTDDKLIESVLRLIYYGGKQPNIFPLQLLELICKNPSVEQKVFDSLMFILMNPNMQEIKKSYQKDQNKDGIITIDEEQNTKQNESYDENVFDFPLLNTYHKNSKETDYKKVYSDVSLKILRIIQKLTMKRVLFFIDSESIKKNSIIDVQSLIQIEKDKGNLGCISELKKYAAEINSHLYNEKSFSLPYFQFIYLLTQEPFRSNYEHLNYLLCSIQNITKKLFQYHSGKQEIEEEETISTIQNVLDENLNQNKSKDSEKELFGGVSKHSVFAKDNSFLLHPDVIRWICSIFSSECLNEILIRKLSLIINQLCYDKNNLEMFINELRNIIKLFSIQINKQIVKCLQSIKSLDRNSPSFSSQFKIHLSQIEFSISGEKKIQKIFQIIYELFEKSFNQLEEESKNKEALYKNQSETKIEINQTNNEQNTQNNQIEIEQEEEEKKQDNPPTNSNTTLGNRIIPQTGFENIQHRNRGVSMVSEQGGNKSSIKKQNISQKNHKEQERLEYIKKEIRSKFSEIISHQNFNELWINCAELFSLLGKYEPNNLSSYNSVIEKLQPIMESYFIIFRIMHDEDFEFIKKGQTQKKSQQQKQISTLADDEILGNTDELSSLNFDTLKESNKDFDIQQIFKFICEQCKVVINQMIRQNLKQKKSLNNRKMNDVLQKDPFEIIFKRSPNLIDFENKKNYFKYEMMNLKISIPAPSQKRRKIKVRRKHIFEDSFQQIDKMKPDELKQKFIIEFDAEEGIDAGGLIREWFILLSKAIFNPDYLLFKPSSSGNTYQPNKSSYLNDPHLQYFKFVGRVVGKALFEGQLLDAYFTRSFYKHILGQPLTYHDIEDQDYEFYKSLKWVMENDISYMSDITFSYEENEFDIIQTIELKPGGKSIPVTEENKQEYVKLICYAKMAKNIKAQIEYFLEGFHELIPYDLVKIFDSHELELMISGLPDIDIMDLRENTEYQNYTSNSKIIEWFWEILEEFDNTQRASFIQFVTGTSKVPVEGFKGLRGISGLQKFQIHKSYDPKKLPIAHTCFNQLDIPEYPTKDILKKKLLLAISEGKEGFGFA